MSDGKICHHDDIQEDDDGSQEVPSSINVGLAQSISKQEKAAITVELPKINI